jgi:hypothetical protein
MSALGMSKREEPRLRKLSAICAKLPEAPRKLAKLLDGEA